MPRRNLFVIDHLLSTAHGYPPGTLTGGINPFAGHIHGQARTLDLSDPAAFVPPFGTCPYCRAEVVSRDPDKGGQDKCERGHIYPAHMTVPPAAPDSDGDASATDAPAKPAPESALWEGFAPPDDTADTNVDADTTFAGVPPSNVVSEATAASAATATIATADSADPQLRTRNHHSAKRDRRLQRRS